MNAVRHGRFVAVLLAAVAVDAASKLAAVRWLADPLDLGVLRLRVTHNTGLAFSLAADQPTAAIVAVTGLVVAILGVAGWRGHLGGAVPAGLVVGGGVANFADRMLGGSVVDIFDLGWWPVFNLADVFLTIGMGLLLLAALLGKHPDDVTPDEPDGSTGVPPGATPVKRS